MPHRQWVFSIPKRLRIYFMFDRSLLTKLSWLSRWILFALMGASICWVVAETDTPFTIFDLSALKMQLLIFSLLKNKLYSLHLFINIVTYFKVIFYT